jgi:hypothetical protein
MAAYPWIPTGDNTYEQKHGVVERFYARFQGHPPQYVILGAVESRVPDAQESTLESRLRETWRAMRYHSPALAALSRPGGRVYQVPDDAALARWEATTFVRHSCDTRLV